MDLLNLSDSEGLLNRAANANISYSVLQTCYLCQENVLQGFLVFLNVTKLVFPTATSDLVYLNSIFYLLNTFIHQ